MKRIIMLFAAVMSVFSCLKAQTPQDSTAIRFPESFSHPGINTVDGAESLDAFFKKAMETGKPRVMMIGDSHVFGKILPNTVSARMKEIWPEMEFTSLSKNGVQLVYFLNAVRYNRIKDFHPDLLIVSVGTNESHNSAFNAEKYQRQMQELASIVDSLSPGTTLLFTTTPGSHNRTYGKHRVSRGGRTRWHSYMISKTPNTRNKTVSDCQADFCRQHGYAIWNLYEIAGGKEYACKNWVATNLMRGDAVHFSAEGYRLQANMLVDALEKLYNDCKKK